MKIINLEQNNAKLYFQCLEDWSDEVKEAGVHKENWYNKMKEKGLRVKLAQDEKGNIGGMIQYLPTEHSVVEGKDLFFVNCIWVHGHKKGRGNFQKRGMGKALLEAAESDVKNLGAKGIVAWGISLPFFMRASWFKKHGYRKIDKEGMQVLLWKPFNKDAEPPKWIRRKKKPDLVPGKVNVTGFLNGWCTAMNITFERAKRAATEFGDKVIFREFDTFDKSTIQEWGISDAIFIDGKEVRTGPPPSYEKIKRKIAKKVKKI
jgi:N-acetylglutamate synthase-like GNAT family acetyltransferase